MLRLAKRWLGRGMRILLLAACASITVGVDRAASAPLTEHMRVPGRATRRRAYDRSVMLLTARRELPIFEAIALVFIRVFVFVLEIESRRVAAVSVMPPAFDRAFAEPQCVDIAIQPRVCQRPMELCA